MVEHQNRELESAEKRFHRTLELGAAAAAEAKLYLGSIIAAQGELDEGNRLLEEFLRDHPQHPKAPTARVLLERIEGSRQQGSQQ